MKKILKLLTACLFCCLITSTAYSMAVNPIVINEVDADTPSNDDQEFIELYDGGTGNTDLSGLVLVLFNGSNDQSYNVFTLDGYTTNGDGFFVIGTVAEADYYVDPGAYGWLQNGADAVALYYGSDSDFPKDTPVTSSNLIDAFVYDTNDNDDDHLLNILTPGQPQINEGGSGDKNNHSNQRCPDGAGGALITTNYTQVEPTPGSANFCTTIEPTIGSCGDTATKIHTIQGSGDSSLEVGTTHVIEGIVVGDFQTGDYLNGFFVQEEDEDIDGDPMTSEGIFVYDGSSPAVDVNVGDKVRVLGTVDEYYTLTEMKNVEVSVCSSGHSVTYSYPTLPMIPEENELEWVEGMLVSFEQDLYVSGNYYLGRYGQVDISANDRLYVPTNVVAPGSDANAMQAANDLNHIILDDGSSTQNPDPTPYMTPLGTLRSGDTIYNLTGVLTYSYDYYRVHPTESVQVNESNPRESFPPIAGGLTVASFNVLNYFVTIDDSGSICGPSGGMDCRGADSLEEFTRQRDKVIAAITAMNADVVGLMEIENHPTDAALIDLVEGLNDVAGAGTYAYVGTGVVGTDAIKVAMIYKSSTVTPIGSAAILDSSVDPEFIDDKNRPSVAQTFQETGSGEKFTVVVNHLKSKGSSCESIGDPDAGDGQGNCNLTRTAAATALVNWLATDPTGSADPDFLIIGDMNSYAKEDPIMAIRSGGYTDLLETLTNPYTYVYSGESGYLDHALANSRLAEQVAEVSTWHINTDEPTVLDYNTEYYDSKPYSADEYRASDHDPVIIGLDLYSESIPGDLNGDGAVEITDYDPLFINSFGTCDGDQDFNTITDLNGDGCVNMIDFQLLYQYYLDYLQSQHL